MGHRATITMATLSDRGLAPHLTQAVAHVDSGSSDQKSFTGNDFRRAVGTRLTGRWVAGQVAAWVASGATSKRGATPCVAVAPDPAPGGARSRQGVAPLLLAGPVVRCGEANTMARAVTGVRDVQCHEPAITPAIVGLPSGAVKARRVAPPAGAAAALTAPSVQPGPAIA